VPWNSVYAATVKNATKRKIVKMIVMESCAFYSICMKVWRTDVTKIKMITGFAKFAKCGYLPALIA